MSPPKKNGTKALSMSQKNAKAIGELRVLVEAHAKDEEIVWGAVRTQVSELHAAWFGDPKDPDRRGWAERLRDAEDYLGSVRKLTWLAVGGFITAVFALVVALAKTALGV